jgi:DNA primase
MTDQRGLSFMDAVKELAARRDGSPPPDPREAEAAEQRAGLHDVMQAAQDWFVESPACPSPAASRRANTSTGAGFNAAPSNASASAMRPMIAPR